MKAYVSGGHYPVYIDNAEYTELLKSPLEAPLQDESDGAEFDKKVVLSYDEHAKRYDVGFVPPDSTWDDLKKINVKLSKAEYERLGSNRFEVMRFSSQSIDLYLVDDLSGFV